MASPVAAALLNLLSGGTQGFAESRQRRTTERAAITERGKERKAQQQQTETEATTRENIAARENASRENVAGIEAGVRQKDIEAQAASDAARLEEEKRYHDAEIKHQADMLQSNTTIEQLQARIAKLQESSAESKFDPFHQIQQVVGEVYTRNATGDTPELAGSIATKAAMDMYKIYQGLGIIPTPIGPVPGGDEGTNPPAAPQGAGAPGKGLFEGGPAYFTAPGITLGGGRIAFGKSAKSLADSLRSLSNAPR